MANSDALPAPVALALRRGVVIPALPLALNALRSLDERRQRALCRYYLAAGAGGIAAGFGAAGLAGIGSPSPSRYPSVNPFR